VIKFHKRTGNSVWNSLWIREFAEVSSEDHAFRDIRINFKDRPTAFETPTRIRDIVRLSRKIEVNGQTRSRIETHVQQISRKTRKKEGEQEERGKGGWNAASFDRRERRTRNMRTVPICNALGGIFNAGVRWKALSAARQKLCLSFSLVAEFIKSQKRSQSAETSRESPRASELVIATVNCATLKFTMDNDARLRGLFHASITWKCLFSCQRERVTRDAVVRKSRFRTYFPRDNESNKADRMHNGINIQEQELDRRPVTGEYRGSERGHLTFWGCKRDRAEAEQTTRKSVKQFGQRAS